MFDLTNFVTHVCRLGSRQENFCRGYCLLLRQSCMRRDGESPPKLKGTIRERDSESFVATTKMFSTLKRPVVHGMRCSTSKRRDASVEFHTSVRVRCSKLFCAATSEDDLWQTCIIPESKDFINNEKFPHFSFRVLQNYEVANNSVTTKDDIIGRANQDTMVGC